MLILLVLCLMFIPILRQLGHDQWHRIGISLVGHQQQGMLLSSYMVLPGTFIHELSHWLMAQLLLVRTKGFLTVLPRIQGDTIIQGYVEFDPKSIDTVRHSIIGAAPLIGNSLAVYLIGEGKLSLYQIGVEIIQGRTQVANELLAQSFATPEAWLWFYLLYIFADGMFPSSVDQTYWRSTLVYLLLVGVVLAALGVMPNVISAAQPLYDFASTFLLATFCIALVTELVMLVILFVIRHTVGLFMGR